MFARKMGLALVAAATVLWTAPALGQEGPSLTIGGTTYSKWLWGTQRQQGAMYNFTTVPGEGYGDNGQGTELELLLDGKLSRQVEVKARLHSRFNQNFWTNFGGFGNPNPGAGCTAGNCGEFDPRSNQYVKLRGAQVILTPGYTWIDSATIGSNDFGQFDPFVIGRIRYIDRDNAQGLLFQGSALGRKLTWDLTRISLPRLWAGPGYSTGTWHASDAAYGGQLRFAQRTWDLGAIGSWTNDQEIDPQDFRPDNGVSLRPRFRNTVLGAKGSVRPVPWLDVRANVYYSWANAFQPESPAQYTDWWFNGFGPVPLGHQEDFSGKLDVVVNDPWNIGLVVNAQVFSIGAHYVSLMASRREADVLLTEGHDAAFAWPGANNSSFGVYGGNPTKIGYGGWSGTAQQVATVNVDNEFTDFDEPMAETAIGWKGITVNPVLNLMPLELAGEYTFLTYNTNWQAFGDDSRPINTSLFPTAEIDSGVGHNFRSAYAPFQDKTTHLAVARARYVLDVGKGIDLLAKVKYIHETDKRLNDPKYLPYQPGDCPGGGAPCANAQRFYSPGNTTAVLYSNPAPLGAGYAWKPFDNIADDDRVLDYWSFTLGAGYQLFDDLYASLSYVKYLADLMDGNTAFQAYGIHTLASGKHDKNQVILKMKYILAGVEFGFEGQYNFGTFKPDFGTGYVAQVIPDGAAQGIGAPIGSLGYPTRRGGWDSAADRDFDNWRLKAFMKAAF